MHNEEERKSTRSSLMRGHSYDHLKTFHPFHYHPKHQHRAKNTLTTPTLPFVSISMSFSFPVYRIAPNHDMFEAIIPHPTCRGSPNKIRPPAEFISVSLSRLWFSAQRDRHNIFRSDEKTKKLDLNHKSPDET